MGRQRPQSSTYRCSLSLHFGDCSHTSADTVGLFEASASAYSGSKRREGRVGLLFWPSDLAVPHFTFQNPANAGGDLNSGQTEPRLCSLEKGPELSDI